MGVMATEQMSGIVTLCRYVVFNIQLRVSSLQEQTFLDVHSKINGQSTVLLSKLFHTYFSFKIRSLDVKVYWHLQLCIIGKYIGDKLLFARTYFFACEVYQMTVRIKSTPKQCCGKPPHSLFLDHNY